MERKNTIHLLKPWKLFACSFLERLWIIMGKKIFGVLLTIFLVFAVTINVNAATLTEDGGSVTVPVRYTVDNTEYIITFPAEITVGNEDTSFEIKAEKMNLRPDEEVVVLIKEGCDPSGNVILKRQQSDLENAPILTTSLTQSGISIVDNDFVVGKFIDGADSTVNTMGMVTMSVPVVDENTKAGDYIGTLQFEVELRKA